MKISTQLLILTLSSLALSSASAQEVTEKVELPKSETEAKEPSKIIITDEMEDFVLNPASPHRISKDKIDLYKYTDVNRALRQTSGAYVREEDGQGLRPNIGLRGTNPDRSKKVTLLEDGVLSGPAPYAAPAAYYTPNMNHTQSLEIYKGFTAVPYGPNSIGGSINYLSLDIPNGFTPKIETSAGAFNTQNHKVSIGDNSGAVGYMVQLSRLSSDGFKELDGGGDVGFFKNEASAKIKTRIAGNEFEARLGYSEEDSNETYLGLSSADISANPFRRYASSAVDKMEWQHSKAELQHTIPLSSTAQLKTTLYRHDFERLWHRLDGFRQVSNDDAPPLFDVLRDPAQFPIQYQILTGQADSSSAGLGGAGDLVILDNQRTFYSQGLQTQFNGQYALGSTTHDVEVGLRYHQDQIRRTHMQNIYQMVGGRLTRTDIAATPKDLNANKASALTLSLLENMKWRSLVFTLLGRVEQVNFDYTNTLGANSQTREDTVFAPGFGVLYHLNNQFSVKTSINRGVSVAGLDDLGSEAKEESVNYEVGVKYISSDVSQQLEVVGFYNDYSNITGTCSSSTGCGASQLDLQFNGGRAAVLGVEGRATQNFDVGAVRIPLQLNVTAMQAEFRNSFTSRTAEWGVGTVNEGDPLPYIPQVQYTFSAGAAYKRFTNEFAFIYQGDSYDQSVAQNRLKIPAYGIVDWTARYQANKQTQLFARADNILGKDYLVSYKPFGARPGKPQSFMVGLSYTF